MRGPAAASSTRGRIGPGANPGLDGSHPVACVSWNDAKAYAAWLSKKTGRDYRLLSEAEWEYAARGRVPTAAGPAPRYSFGDDETAMCRNGNVADRTARRDVFTSGRGTVFPCDDGYAYTAPTGSFLPNGFGLYDMLGNVWEWMEDCYRDSYAGAPSDGAAWLSGDCGHRVLRGGAWFDSPALLRAAYRSWSGTGDRTNGYGFRVARTLSMP
jgi:formylglycine-generating enzyme required for sulfatase activity